VDLDDAKGLVELLARRLGLEPPAWRALGAEPLRHPGRAGAGAARGSNGSVGLAGRVGELHPRLLEEWELRTDRLLVAELSVAGLSGGALPAVHSSPPPRVPAAERDLAIVVARETPAADVAAAIRASGGALLDQIALFDVYAGPPLAEGARSLAWRLIFSAPDRTLTDGEIESAMAAIIAAVERQVGGRIRS
jgi:phenylalanyl-tRNA synthetase beta chain